MAKQSNNTGLTKANFNRPTPLLPSEIMTVEALPGYTDTDPGDEQDSAAIPAETDQTPTELPAGWTRTVSGDGTVTLSNDADAESGEPAEAEPSDFFLYQVAALGEYAQLLAAFQSALFKAHIPSEFVGTILADFNKAAIDAAAMGLALPIPKAGSH